MKRPKRDGANEKRTTRPSVGGRKGSRVLNSLCHGIFLQEAVIPGVESEREFRRFQSKVMEAKAPRDEFQRWMAMRIVRLAWRLNRVEMYEAAVIARDQQKAEEETAEVVQTGREARLLEVVLKTGRFQLELLRGLPSLAPETTVSMSKALEVLGFVADFAEVKLEDVVDLAAKTAEGAAGALWTSTQVLEGIAAIAGRADAAPDGLRQAAVLHLVEVLASGEAEAKAVCAARDHQRRLRLLPDSNELDRVLRYEAHLSRLMMQALHEYEALQARDRGERVPLARLDVEGLA